jgi:hypothetical protein
MSAPKPGDVLTAEQARVLPIGAAVDVTYRLVLDREGFLNHCVEQGDRVTLVSLPTPPDMAPGSLIEDDRGHKVFRFSNQWREVEGGVIGLLWDWADLAPHVARVLHDAAVTS